MMRLLAALVLVGAVHVCAQIPGEMQSLSVRVGLTSRSFLLYVPPTWTASDTVPLVLNWHGLTDSPAGQANTSKANEYADLYGWAVAYPAGTLASHNGGACCTPASSLRVNDVGFARALVADVSSRMSIRSDAVFTMGYSNGAFMSERLACEASDLFAAVGSNAGRMAPSGDFKSCEPARPIPVIAISGTLDLLVPYIGNPLLKFPSFIDDLSNMQGSMGCDSSESPYVKNVTDTTTCELFSQCGGNGVFLEYCTVWGGDHTWFTSPDIDSSGYFFARFAEVAGLEPKGFLKLPKASPKIPEHFP